MPSHLTRVVFRSIIANKPLLYRGCLYRSLGPRPVFQNASRLITPASQRRTFINLSFLKPKRKAQKEEVPPGLDEMSRLSASQRYAEQPPPPEEVAKGFKLFFRQKSMRFEDFHIILGSLSFKYLLENPRPDGTPWLASQGIVQAIGALRRRPETGGEPHLAFARALNEELARRAEARKAQGEETAPADLPNQRVYLTVLCFYGASLEARELAIQMWRGAASASTTEKKQAAKTWESIFAGFVHEGNADELLRTAELVLELGIPFVESMQTTLVTFFAKRGDLEQAKRWYSHPVNKVTLDETEPADNTHAVILQACAVAGDLTYGQKVVAALLAKTPSKPAWDAIFVWSTAIGKGVDEIDRMMSVMVRRNDEERAKDRSIPMVRPDIDTINSLVQFSVSKKDPYLAERFIALGEKRGILPDAKTFTMQMEYRLAANDIDGARTAYFGLEGKKNEAAVAATNKLICAMCSSKQHQFDDIMAIVDDLHEHKAWFEPTTVGVLCEQHLRRGEKEDAVDLIQLHANFYSPQQRLMIRDHLVAFLLDRQNNTADAWDTYQILRSLFPETPRDLRIKIMNEFFDRKRADMGCHVFFHMRNHTFEDIRANKDVYVAAFTGFARNKDAESLELAHNQLKLDVNLDMDTKLRNALMLAYASVGKNIRALEFWTEIVASKEGPTYNSIVIAFRACEGMPWGDRHAKPIWVRLRQMDMDIDKRIFTAYLGAIASNFLHDEAVMLVERVEEELGFEPDLYMLGNWFNATQHIANQAKVEAWIKQHYPEVWTEFEALGHVVTMDGFGFRQYNLNRDLDP